MKRESQSITLIEFEAIKPLLKLSDDRIEAARLVLFENMTMEAAGKQFNWSKQHISKTVNKVLEILIAYRTAKKIEQKLLDNSSQLK